MASAHCDSMDGPVVRAAKQALASGDVTPVLPWIRPDQESTVRDAFERTISVRNLNSQAKALADTWFFETVVRIHRAGEGASYEGLKPAGSGISPGVAAADKAIETGDMRVLESALPSDLQDRLRERFNRLIQLKKFEPSDVSAGREYVAAYVEFIHSVEQLDEGVRSDSGHAEQHLP